MSKIEMTPEIGFKIKEWRLKYNIKAIDLANFINKSAAYITKLEKSDIKFIERELLEKIITFISSSTKTYDDFMLDIAKRMTSEELENLLWFLNYDKIERKIPIPPSLIDYIESKITELNISKSDLISYINQNEDLDESFFNDYNINVTDYENNKWYIYMKQDVLKNEKNKFFILLKYSLEKFNNLLDKKMDKCNHTYLYAIIYHLLKYECKVNNQILNDEAKETLSKKVNKILQENKFYTISDRNIFAENSKSIEEYHGLLSEFDLKNKQLVNELLTTIVLLSDYDVKYTNEKLTKIVANAKMDTSFALSYMAISLEGLSKIDTSNKKEFLMKIDELVQTYSNKEDTVTIEKY